MSDESCPDIDSSLPEVVQDFLRSGAKLEEIRLDERGNWTHEGLDFENPRVADLFSRSVGRTSGGTWVLEIGRFTYPIVVEDTGFFIDRVDWSEAPPLLQLSDSTTEPLDLETLQYEPGGRLYCRVKDREFRARFKRGAYHSIMPFLHDEDHKVVLKLGDRQQVLADLDDLDE